MIDVRQNVHRTSNILHKKKLVRFSGNERGFLIKWWLFGSCGLNLCVDYSFFTKNKDIEKYHHFYVFYRRNRHFE
jgi:hypothetical protein